MLKKVLSLVVVVSLFHAGFCVQTASARSKAEKQARFAEKVKAGVEKLGVGEETYVTVKLRDKTKLTGYISETRKDGFVVADAKTGKAAAVAYADVKQIRGQNLTRGQKIALGVGVAAAIFLIVAYFIVSATTD